MIVLTIIFYYLYNYDKDKDLKDDNRNMKIENNKSNNNVNQEAEGMDYQRTGKRGAGELETEEEEFPVAPTSELDNEFPPEYYGAVGAPEDSYGQAPASGSIPYTVDTEAYPTIGKLDAKIDTLRRHFLKGVKPRGTS